MARRLTIQFQLTILFFASLFLHFWRLDVPHEVVFDEVHFGKFINSYCCTHQRFFDVHPPLAKLLIAATAGQMGLDGTFSFEKIGQNYDIQPAFWLRFWPAVVGTLLPILAYLLLIELKASTTTALIGGMALMLENATLVETRYILLDGFLIFAILGGLYCCLKARSGSWRWGLAAGLFAAMACLTKFTGLVTILCPLFFLKYSRSKWKTITSFGLTLGVLYLTVWSIHFHNQALPGTGDAFYIPKGHFFSDLVSLHKEMYRANSTITTPHPDASRAWSWPIMKTPPFYWTSANRYIYLFGNVVLWWGSLLGLLGIAIHFILGRWGKVVKLDLSALGPLLVLYGAYYAPFWIIHRPLFMYHYLPALWLSVMATIIWLEQIGVFPRYRRVFLIAVAMGFLAAVPITYGFSVAPFYLKILYWRPEFFLH